MPCCCRQASRSHEDLRPSTSNALSRLALISRPPGSSLATSYARGQLPWNPAFRYIGKYAVTAISHPTHLHSSPTSFLKECCSGLTSVPVSWQPPCSRLPVKQSRQRGRAGCVFGLLLALRERRGHAWRPAAVPVCESAPEARMRRHLRECLTSHSSGGSSPGRRECRQDSHHMFISVMAPLQPSQWHRCL